MPHLIYKLISTTVNLYDSSSDQYAKETTYSTNVKDLPTSYDTLTNKSLNLNDSLTNSTSYVPYENRPETYVIPIIFSIIFLLGNPFTIILAIFINYLITWHFLNIFVSILCFFLNLSFIFSFC